MKHNLTPEQIVYVLFGLLMILSLGGVWLDTIKKDYYERGYTDGWRRAKATFGKGFTR